jgi:azobenzene reductase
VIDFAIVSGSQRTQSQSLKVARYFEREIPNVVRNARVTLLDLAENVFPLWDDGTIVDEEAWERSWSPWSEAIAAADAYVFVTPEWGGMATPALKNFFLLCNREELGHKPALAVGVSSANGGAYPIAELRMTSGKNTHVCYIPEHVIVRHVERVLNTVEGDPKAEDAQLRKRIAYAIRVLGEYAKALGLVRASGVVEPSAFPFGM